MFVALLHFISTIGWTAEWRKILRCEKDVADLGRSAQQQKDIAEHPEFAEFVRLVQAGELSDKAQRGQAWRAAWFAKQQRDGTWKTWEPLITHGLQAIRLSATYVDLTPSGDGWTDPTTLDPGVPEFLCAAAAAFLVFMLACVGLMRENLREHELLARISHTQGTHRPGE